MQSIYEKLFGVPYRGRGRPIGRTRDQVVFDIADREHEDLAEVARKRAIAVVMEEGRERLRQIYENEYEYLVKHHRGGRDHDTDNANV